MTNVQRSAVRCVFPAPSACADPKAQRIFNVRMPRVACTPAAAPSPLRGASARKQRLRAQYGISEKQLRAAYEEAPAAGQTGNAMSPIWRPASTPGAACRLRARPPRPVSSWCTVTSRRRNVVVAVYRVKPGQTIR